MGTHGQKDRHRAKELHAVEARDLIDTMPGLLAALSASQIKQIQDVLDAAVLNPVIQKEGDDIYRRSITAQIGNQINRDEAMVRKADRVWDGMIPVNEKSRHIKLDALKLLTPDALTPRTDNPDEAKYLGTVKNTILSKGIWLRISQPYVRDKEDPSRHVKDPTKWELWFSLGYDGDAIPTKDGRIDRDELLGTTMLGAGYYRAVHTGYVQTALKRQINRLQADIDEGMAEHYRLIRRKDDAAPGVAEISDFLGGADLPSINIWNGPHKMIIKALELNVGGNVMASQVYLVVAAVNTRNAAKLLADYADDSSRGASRAITVLKVAKTAGEVAEVGLALTGVGVATKVVRGGSTVGTAVAADEALEVATEKFVAKYAKKNGIEAELKVTRYVRQPKGSVAGGVKPGTSSGAGTGWHKW